MDQTGFCGRWLEIMGGFFPVIPAAPIPVMRGTLIPPVILRSAATKNLAVQISTIRMAVVGAGVVRSFASLRMTKRKAQDDTGKRTPPPPPSF